MGNTTLILGITGNIASGKSLVAELLQKKGASLLSADQIAREVVAPGTALLAELKEMFGSDIVAADGALDRERLGRLVFADAEARQRLNNLLHPAIGALAEKKLAVLAASDVPLVVYEAPLLFEAGAEKRVDSVLMVTVSPELQEQRVVERDGFDLAEARRRIAAQMPQAEKAARADYLLDNSGSVEDLQLEVDKLWTRLTGED